MDKEIDNGIEKVIRNNQMKNKLRVIEFLFLIVYSIFLIIDPRYLMLIIMIVCILIITRINHKLDKKDLEILKVMDQQIDDFIENY